MVKRLSCTQVMRVQVPLATHINHYLNFFMKKNSSLYMLRQLYIDFKYLLIKQTLKPAYYRKRLHIRLTYNILSLKAFLRRIWFRIKTFPTICINNFFYYKLSIYLFIEYEKRWRKTFPKPYRMVPRLFPKIHNWYLNDCRIRFRKQRRRWRRIYHKWRREYPILKSPLSNVIRVFFIEHQSVFFLFWLPTLYYTSRFLHLLITEDFSILAEYIAHPEWRQK